MVDKDKLADRVLAKSFRENPREASLKDQAGMLRAIRDPLTNRAFNMDGCAALEASKQEDTCTLCGMYGHQCARCKASKQEAQGGQVAYLDIGAGGYVDLGSDLTPEQLQALPLGRHALAIVGTFGIDGYTAATPATPAQAEREPASVTTAQTVDQIIADDQRRKQAEEFDWSGTDDPEPERVALTPQEIVLAGWSWRKYAQGTKEGRAFLYGALFAQEYHGIGTSATKEGV